jgi:cytoskeletal protein CcmA (bactofilin family)
MFDSLRDRKSTRKEEGPAAMKSDHKNPETSAVASKNSRGSTTGRQTPASRLPIGGQRSKPTIGEQMKRVSQFTNNPVPGTPRSRTAGEPDSQKLTVGPGIHLRGDISNCDTLQVQGQIEASAKTRKLEISECGTYIGTAEIETADISGRFEGDLTVADRLIIRATGQVSGKINYQSIQIEAGGEIAGEIHVTEKPEPIEEPEPMEEPEPEAKAEPQITEETAETENETEVEAAESEIDEPKQAAAGGS